MWEYTFDAPINERIMNSRFHGITIIDSSNLWWVDDLKVWMEHDDIPKNYNYGTHWDKCKSFKAFKRHLRKHENILKGYEIVLCSRYIGCNIRAKWNEKLEGLKE